MLQLTEMEAGARSEKHHDAPVGWCAALQVVPVERAL